MILIVDDHAQVRKLVRLVLEGDGYAVLEAGSAAEALARSAEHAGAIDLLLTDVAMPGMCGGELARRLRQHRPAVPVLFMSGSAWKATLCETVPGADVALLRKPFTLSALRCAVQAALAEAG